jgi:hypothetical protein
VLPIIDPAVVVVLPIIDPAVVVVLPIIDPAVVDVVCIIGAAGWAAGVLRVQPAKTSTPPMTPTPSIFRIPRIAAPSRSSGDGPAGRTPVSKHRRKRISRNDDTHLTEI